MTLEQRVHRDYFAGVLQLQALNSDLTLTSTAFAALPSTFSTAIYMPIVLHNPSTGVYEVVYIVGHSAASNTVTVQRGKEGTSAQAWPANTQVIDAATVRDLIAVYTRAGLPADPFVGMRALVSDESNTLLARFNGGWGPAIGMALAKSVGPLRAGGNPPDSSILMATTGILTNITPNGTGQFTINWRQAFPNACVNSFAWSADATRVIGWITPITETVSSGTFYAHTMSGGGILAVTTGPISVGYVALGY